MSDEIPAGFALWGGRLPSKIIGVGLNYLGHAIQQGKSIPEEPLLFMKPPSAIIPSGAAIERPKGSWRVDFEGELGVVIGKRSRSVSVDRALEFVHGYTLVNDVTVRDLQKKDVQYTRAKGFDTFCPVGPRVVPGLQPDKLQLRTRVNGEIRQDAPVSDMIFSVPKLIAFISSVMTLEPGDLITTGTPGGHGPIVPGDVVEVEIEGIGILKNPVVERA